MVAVALLFPSHGPIGEAGEDLAGLRRRQEIEGGTGLGGILFGSAASIAEGAGLPQRREQGVARAGGIAQESTERGGVGRGESLKGVNQRQRKFLLGQISSQRLAGRLLKAGEIEQVVGDLEGDAK